MYLQRNPIPFIRKLMKDHTPKEVQEAEERFYRYLELSYQIYQRNKHTLEKLH